MPNNKVHVYRLMTKKNIIFRPCWKLYRGLRRKCERFALVFIGINFLIFNFLFISSRLDTLNDLDNPKMGVPYEDGDRRNVKEGLREKAGESLMYVQKWKLPSEQDKIR